MRKISANVVLGKEKPHTVIYGNLNNNDFLKHD